MQIYFKGASRNWSQLECDERFYSDSKKVCDCTYTKISQIFSKIGCRAAAYAFYGIVKLLGHNFYIDKSHDYCNNTCINDFAATTSIFWKLKR